MSPARGEQQTRRSLLGAFRDADLSIEQLWLRYFALGGDAALIEIEGYLQGLMPLPALQHDMLAHALNERLDELASSRRAEYIRPVLESRPSVGPLASLVRLLEGMHQAAPERLPSAVADAGHALGLQAVVYLVDVRPAGERDLGDLDVRQRQPVGGHARRVGLAQRPWRLRIHIGVTGENGGHPRLEPDRECEIAEAAVELFDCSIDLGE